MIDSDALKSVTARLIFESLTPEDREKLLTGALQSLVEPQAGSYGAKRPSRLEEMFFDRARIEASSMIAEYFQTTEVKAKLTAFVTAAVDKAFSGEMMEQVSKRMVSALWRDH